MQGLSWKLLSAQIVIFEYTPHANMADHSFVSWNELYES